MFLRYYNYWRAFLTSQPFVDNFEFMREKFLFLFTLSLKRHNFICIYTLLCSIMHHMPPAQSYCQALSKQQVEALSCVTPFWWFL